MPLTPVTRPVAGVHYPQTLPEFLNWLPDDAACLAYLEKVRWPGGGAFMCRWCGVVDGGYWQLVERKCQQCRKTTTVTAGTMFAGTHSSLLIWFQTIWFLVNQKNGMSALGLQQALGLGSYQTAWTRLHKLRRCMGATSGQLSCTVEADETLFGGIKSAKYKGRSPKGKAIIDVAVEGAQTGPPGRVRMLRIPDAKAASLIPFIQDVITPGSTIHTDAWGAYTGSKQGIPSLGGIYTHTVTHMSASGDPAHVTMPHVHRCSNAGCLALTRAVSAGSTWTTTSRSSPSASTAASQSIAACSSTASSSRPWRQSRRPTQASSFESDAATNADRTHLK